MEKSSRNEGVNPHLLDLISKDRNWVVNLNEEKSHGLELRLGPPGEKDWSFKSLSCPWSSSAYQPQSKTPFLQFPSNPSKLSVMGREPSLSASTQPCCTKVVELQNSEKKPTLPNISQKRTAPAPVVGWPPIRSFRKNLASNGFSKPSAESQTEVSNKDGSEKPLETCKKSLFVKINMEGIPIGRKVDLKAYDSYEKLSTAVDELFRDLLAVQKNSSAAGVQNKKDGEKVITGVLDGGGEYTLVYEDNEGDRMLVGDVPWHMFLSTVKRLHVLKSSELSSLSLGSSKGDKMTLDFGLK